MHERRRFSRWQINKQAKLRLEGAFADAPCVIHNINFNGARISFNQKLDVDTFVKMKIMLCEEHVIDVQAWVVWHKTRDGSHMHGLYFSEISELDKEKIYRFIYEHFPQELVTGAQQKIIPEKGGERMRDRRIFARIAAQYPLKYFDSVTGKEGQAHTVDISARGVGLTTHQLLRPHAALEMWIQMPDRGEPLYTRGEVVWSEKHGVDNYRAGVNLEKADLMGMARVLRAA